MHIIKTDLLSTFCTEKLRMTTFVNFIWKAIIVSREAKNQSALLAFICYFFIFLLQELCFHFLPHWENFSRNNGEILFKSYRFSIAILFSVEFSLIFLRFVCVNVIDFSHWGERVSFFVLYISSIILVCVNKRSRKI